MPKVIQVRDVPDEVHDALQAAAAREGMSLTRFVRAELSRSARRSDAARHNADVVARARARGAAAVDRATILGELSAGREG